MSLTRLLRLAGDELGRFEGKSDVLGDGERRIERIGLERHGDAAPRGRQRMDGAAIERDRAVVTSSKPAIMRKVEVLPQPEEPSSAVISPGLTVRLRSLTACTGALRRGR